MSKIQLTENFPGETTEEFLKRVTSKLMERTKSAESKLAEWCKGQSRVITCETHSMDRHVDWERSVQWCVNNPTETPRFVFAKCPKCEVDERMRQSAAWMVERGVPVDMSHAAFENFIPTEPLHDAVISSAKQFIKTGKGFFILLGGVGTGKTHVAISIMREFGSGRFVTQSSIMEDKSHHYADNRNPDPVIRLSKTPFLVIDEIGLSRSGTDVADVMTKIITARYDAKLPTVLTSNLPYAGFVELVGYRVEDRLKRATFYMAAMTGQSKRKRDGSYFQ